MESIKSIKISRHAGLTILSLFTVLVLGHSNTYALPVGFEAYEVEITGAGRHSASALSEQNVARVEVSAFFSGDIDGYPLVGEASAYASSESYLEVRGGEEGNTVLVDIAYSLEIGIWKSANDSIGSANSLIDIVDVGLSGVNFANADSLNILWEAELDAHFAGSNTTTAFGQGDEFVTLTHTLSLLSGHDYLIALETWAGVTASYHETANQIFGGWARAEAFADPSFSLAAGNGDAAFSLNHITPDGSATASVPLPATAWLFAPGLLMLSLRRTKRI